MIERNEYAGVREWRESGLHQAAEVFPSVAKHAFWHDAIKPGIEIQQIDVPVRSVLGLDKASGFADGTSTPGTTSRNRRRHSLSKLDVSTLFDVIAVGCRFESCRRG